MLRHWWGPRGRGSRWWQQSASDRRTSVHKREPVCFSFARRAIARARKIGESGENRSGRVPFRLVRVFIRGKPRARDGAKFAKTGAQRLVSPFLPFPRINRNETPSGCRDSSPLDDHDPSLTQHFAKFLVSIEREAIIVGSVVIGATTFSRLIFFFLSSSSSSSSFSRVRRRLLDELAYGCNAWCWWLRFHVFAIPSDRWSSSDIITGV